MIEGKAAPAASQGSRRKTKGAEASPRVLRKAARAPASPEPAPAIEPMVRTPAAGKLGQMVVLMRRERGASLTNLMVATGWQAHSVRGAIAGSLKRARGYEIASAKVNGIRVYTIAPEASA
ncbi:MAG: DUF3489 domain-containing protein [Alphaproteobacteria bacterium]|nr:MAG: DUF3489 domain-containing protein [Alphaproteobacteria bacterium]